MVTAPVRARASVGERLLAGARAHAPARAGAGERLVFWAAIATVVLSRPARSAERPDEEGTGMHWVAKWTPQV
jgi:hypothetical protein